MRARVDCFFPRGGPVSGLSVSAADLAVSWYQRKATSANGTPQSSKRRSRAGDWRTAHLGRSAFRLTRVDKVFEGVRLCCWDEGAEMCETLVTENWPSLEGARTDRYTTPGGSKNRSAFVVPNRPNSWQISGMGVSRQFDVTALHGCNLHRLPPGAFSEWPKISGRICSALIFSVSAQKSSGLAAYFALQVIQSVRAPHSEQVNVARATGLAHLSRLFGNCPSNLQCAFRQELEADSVRTDRESRSP